jgi:Ca-activated chloride channel family protein
MKRLSFGRFCLFLAIAVFLSSCDSGPEKKITQKDSSESLTILAGSEISDLEPYFKQIEQQTGVALQVSYTGTLDGAERLIGGESFDAAWFSHSKYYNLLDAAGNNRINKQTKIMLSPVILGVKESYAQKWGWDNSPVTWKEIAQKAIDGELMFAMTEPTSSNTGFTALIGLSAAFGDNLSEAKEKLKGFFNGQTATAGSSSWLVESYVKDEIALNGIINYESVLISLNQSERLKEKLTLIYPSDGIVTADYPLLLLNSDKKAAYEKVVQYLMTPAFQQLIMDKTFRRPVITSIQKSTIFSSVMLMELPFPGTLEDIDQILFAYLDEIRRPSTPIFVLDVSGSMNGERLKKLKEAINNLTGVDNSLTGQFARFRKREEITFLAFNDRVSTPKLIEIIDTRADGPSMGQIRSYINSLQAGGGTAIYDALLAAYQLVAENQKKDRNRLYSIVLLTDGRNEHGNSLAQFEMEFATISEDVRRAKTYPIIFGGADSNELERIAELTGGRIFDGTKSLSKTFKVIRGYQ